MTQTMREGNAARLTDRGVLQVNGADRHRFLQGLVSNDVDRLRPDAPIHAALLSPQGKYLFDFIIHERGDGLLLDVDAARLEELRRRLTLYRLRADVELTARPDLAVVAWWGDAPAPAEAPRDPRLAALGHRAVLPAAEAEAWPPDVEAYDRHRLALGVPGDGDLVPQKSLLLESNFEELNGVAFDKGCFVGQELTARTKHRALVRKRLLPVRLHGPAPEAGTIVRAGERDAGEMRSSRGDRGMALLRLEQLGSGPLRAGDTVLEPEVPDWLDVNVGAAVSRPG